MHRIETVGAKYERRFVDPGDVEAELEKWSAKDDSCNLVPLAKDHCHRLDAEKNDEEVKLFGNIDVIISRHAFVGDNGQNSIL